MCVHDLCMDRTKEINLTVFSSRVFRKEKLLFGFGSQFSQLADKSMLTGCAGQPFWSRAAATQRNSPSLRIFIKRARKHEKIVAGIFTQIRPVWIGELMIGDLIFLFSSAIFLLPISVTTFKTL
jgi:hypothetical protein